MPLHSSSPQYRLLPNYIRPESFYDSSKWPLYNTLRRLVIPDKIKLTLL